MSTIIRHNPLRSRSLHRALAVLLLTLATFDLGVADIFFTDSCNNDTAFLSVASDDLAVSPAALMSSLADNDSHHDSDADRCCKGEDCFCCCSHVLPRYPAGDIALLNQGSVRLSEINLPSAPSRITYRPPRTA